MKNTKLLKSILISTLEISAIESIAAVSTSCSYGVVHVDSIKIDPISTTLTIGESKHLTVALLPENATDKSVVWSSDNESVATVDQNGKITAVSLGNTTITVTTNDGGLTATCAINVTNVSEYVGITANANSTLTLANSGGNNPDLQYSTDGTNWTTYSTTININQDQKLYLKGNNPIGWSSSTSVYSSLSIAGDVSISGNVMALLDNGTYTKFSIPFNYCFYNLFEDSTGIRSVSDRFLPAKTLAQGCYQYMFYHCKSLTTAPELPATTLANYCYNGMFRGCSKLSTVPELPALTLAEGCYYDMFANCTTLLTPPELPATKLKNRCYVNMFNECTSLLTPPELPAKVLAEGCYSLMFEGCTSLTTAPDLPARTLENYCYSWMFQGCSSLNSIKIFYDLNYNIDYFYNWVNGIAGSGTFYYNGDDSIENFGFTSSGWTRVKFN